MYDGPQGVIVLLLMSSLGPFYIRVRAQFEVGPIQNILELQLIGPSCDIGFGIGLSNIKSLGPIDGPI